MDSFIGSVAEMVANMSMPAFRVWDADSNGFNTPTKFASQLSVVDPLAQTFKQAGLHWDANRTPVRKDGPRRSGKNQAKERLNRKWDPRSSTIFITMSLAQAIVHAIWLFNQQRKGKRRPSKIFIICFDIATAKTDRGHPVNFRAARDVVVDFKLKMTAAHIFDEQDFRDVYMTSDTFMPGPGSRIVEFNTLELNGLYDCVPEFHAIKCVTPGVARPIKHLRAFWGQSEVDLSEEEITLAARLAALFQPIHFVDNPNLLDMHIFACFLMMKDQGPSLPGLMVWLQKHAHPVADGARTTYTAMPTELPEVKRSNELMAILSPWYVKKNEVDDLSIEVPKGRVQARRRAFVKKRWERNQELKKLKKERKEAADLKRVAEEPLPLEPRKKAKLLLVKQAS